jgi:hypothetical protein
VRACVRAWLACVACVQIGWVDLDFVGSVKEGVGVGDDKHSWGYDGNRVILWYNGQRGWGQHWKTGDTIGCACDVDARTISFSHNGSWSGKMGTAAENMEFVGGLSPGVTLNGPCKISVNFGDKPFKYQPRPGHLSVQSFIDDNDPAKASSSQLQQATEPFLDDQVFITGVLPAGAAASSSLSPPGSPLPGSSSSLSSSSLTLPTPGLSRSLSRMTPSRDTRRSITMRVSSGFAHTRMEREDNVVSATDHFPSAVADMVLLKQGRWYYEATLVGKNFSWGGVPGGGERGASSKAGVSAAAAALASPGGRPRELSLLTIGWGDKNFFGQFDLALGVGDDASSWGLSFGLADSKPSLRHNGARYTRPWASSAAATPFAGTNPIKNGDVIGCCVDIDAGIALFSVNGVWGPPYGLAFSGMKVSTGLLPAVSVSAGVRYATFVACVLFLVCGICEFVFGERVVCSCLTPYFFFLLFFFHLCLQRAT